MRTVEAYASLHCLKPDAAVPGHQPQKATLRAREIRFGS